MVDEFLQNLVGATERTGAEIDVTLNVGGNLVSGTLVSQEEYIKIIARRFSDVADETAAPDEGIVNLFRGFLGEQSSQALEEPLYVHLRNPKIYQQGIRAGITGFGWRGRLESVDGFQFGSPSNA